ncbi:succinylglutamate desuccinylase/aspartoacylase family protein [Legionella sp. W05-934-2]|jgi:predicted deacylase|uniref:succinylglutamate desuccinylase/aspartoacylase family protein n=1 Tax=Legionella sp. W05-934-2 TaxID=1198649 RepID=UPI00346366ED
MDRRPPFYIGGQAIPAGNYRCVKLQLPLLYSTSPIEVPVHIFHGKKEGPILFVSGAVHGDEILGVEIIRRLHHQPQLKKIRGTLITLPVVNVYGFLLQSRYLPDRRDLNRQFPGQHQGSLASRLAQLLMAEIIEKCTHGIDLHTGAIHRSNYPQIRVSHSNSVANEMAEAFAAPVIINSPIRAGSLREAADKRNIPIIVYEVGEALRFDLWGIKLGVRGILRTMNFLNMFPPSMSKKFRPISKIARAESSFWIRAPQSGMVVTARPLGSYVKKDEILADMADPMSDETAQIVCPCDAVIIGKTNIPLVNEGDALFHLGLFEDWHQLTFPPNIHPEWQEDDDAFR